MINSEAKYTRADMEKCFEAGVKFGRDMFSNPSNSEYMESLENDQETKNSNS